MNLKNDPLEVWFLYGLYGALAATLVLTFLGLMP